MNSRKFGWKRQGEYYGYPSCCIEAFLKGEQVFESFFSGTGFLPCKFCHENKSVISLLMEINRNRECDKPFTMDKSSIRYSRFEYMFWESFWVQNDKLFNELKGIKNVR